jgi:hypothetical protein
VIGECGDVDGPAVGEQLVALGCRDDPDLTGQQPTQPGHVGLHRPGRVGADAPAVGVPDQLGEQLGAHRRAEVGDQGGQQPALPHRAEPDRSDGPAEQNRPEDADRCHPAIVAPVRGLRY